MSLRMDPRLAERRKAVREQSARGSLRRLLWVLGAGALLGAALWLIQSPLLAVSQLVVHGATAGRAAPILEQENVGLGRPLLLVRPGRLEEALLSDPWISEAEVSLVLPDTVEIELRERQAGAWLLAPSPVLLATDGVILEVGGGPQADGFVIRLDAEVGARGELHPDSRVLGALSFLTPLQGLVPGPISVTEQAGELWAEVGDIDVRLGRPTAMEAKASALVAILDGGVEGGSTIVLLAPTRPAVVEPQALQNNEAQPQVEP
ncbi:MAG: cell division protein FtsQ/DivIB [Acidimicrobiia bacterium]